MIKYTSCGGDRVNYLNPEHVTHVHMSKTAAWVLLSNGEKLEVSRSIGEHIVEKCNSEC